MITLLIADDHPLYRDALRGALSVSLQDIRLLEAGDLPSTIDILEKEDVDLLLLDLHMPGSNDLFGLLHVLKLYSDLPVAVVSGTEDPLIISKIVGCGALGFIPTPAGANDIAKAIKSILEANVWLPEAVHDKIEEVTAAVETFADHV